MAGSIKFWSINIFYLKVRNRIYFQFLKLKKSIFRPTAPLRILFSDAKPDWSEEILKGFKHSKHSISFDALNEKNSLGYDLLVPLTIHEQESKALRDLMVNNAIPLASVESIRLCDDKYQFNEALKASGFGKYIPGTDGSHSFPYMLKKKIDQYGENTHIIKDEQEEKAYSEKLNSPDYFTQEIISGRSEYATHIVYKIGKIESSLNIKYTFGQEISIKGKDKSITSICGCPYLKVFSSILESIGYEGLCCFNYKVRDNIPYIIEINPRFGGSLTPYFSLFVSKN